MDATIPLIKAEEYLNVSGGVSLAWYVPSKLSEMYTMKENYKNDKALYRLATISDAYYKDKKIAYQHYKKYIENFDKKDTLTSIFVKKRIKEIKKEFFLKGQNIK